MLYKITPLILDAGQYRFKALRFEPVPAVRKFPSQMTTPLTTKNFKKFDWTFLVLA